MVCICVGTQVWLSVQCYGGLRLMWGIILFHLFIEAGSQSNPKLANMARLVSHLVSAIAFKDWNYRWATTPT